MKTDTQTVLSPSPLGCQRSPAKSLYDAWLREIRIVLVLCEEIVQVLYQNLGVSFESQGARTAEDNVKSLAE